MNRTDFWRTFDLNTELHSAGNFLHTGLSVLDKCEHLENEDEVFDILYHLAVGFERLFKVAIVLLEHTPDTDQLEFEKSLITHNHMTLLERIRSKTSLPLSTPHHTLLACLGNFYQTFRYDRFNLASVADREKEGADFRLFIAKGIDVQLGTGETLFPTYDMPRIRRFVGRTVGKIAERAFAIVKQAAEANGLYTYELRTESKAFKIFMRNEYDFIKEDIAWKELLLYLIKTKDASTLSKLTDDFVPLDFGPGDAMEHLDAFRSETKRTELIDLVESLHEDVRPVRERLELLELIGAKTAFIVMDEDVPDGELEPDGGPDEEAK